MKDYPSLGPKEKILLYNPPNTLKGSVYKRGIWLEKKCNSKTCLLSKKIGILIEKIGKLFEFDNLCFPMSHESTSAYIQYVKKVPEISIATQTYIPF